MAYRTLSTQCYVPAWLTGGGEVWGRMDTCICIAESLCFSPETTTTLFIGYACLHAESFQSCLTVTYGCSLPGSSVHGIFQAKILEWVTSPFFRGSSQPISLTSSALVGGFFITGDTWEARIP